MMSYDLCIKNEIEGVPKIVKTVTTQLFSVIVMEYVGKSLDFVIDTVNNSFDIGVLLGKKLKQIHTVGQTDSGTVLIKQNPKVLKLAEIAKTDDELKKLLMTFLECPGKTSYVHGDASISNFVHNDGTIYLIDIGSMIKYIDSYDRPIGIPAYEYYQLISSIYWKVEDKAKADEFKNGFVKGYGQTGFTEAADKLCKYFWKCNDY